MSENVQKIIKVDHNHLWIIGFLFTLGLVIATNDSGFQTAVWWKQILYTLAIYAIWPVFLGAYVGGGI